MLHRRMTFRTFIVLLFIQLFAVVQIGGVAHAHNYNIPDYDMHEDDHSEENLVCSVCILASNNHDEDLMDLADPANDGPDLDTVDNDEAFVAGKSVTRLIAMTGFADFDRAEATFEHSMASRQCTPRAPPLSI